MSTVGAGSGCTVAVYPQWVHGPGVVCSPMWHRRASSPYMAASRLVRGRPTQGSQRGPATALLALTPGPAALESTHALCVRRGNVWTRTKDLPLFRRTLYLLSYSAVHTHEGAAMREGAVHLRGCRPA